VRIPRLVTFTVGAVVGGVAVYLSDATNGPTRRKSAAKDVARLLGRAGRNAGAGALSMVSEFGAVARDTFTEQRAGHASWTSRP
jgi:hypothetical protein